MENQERMLQDELRSAVEDKELPSIYFNSFITSISLGDVVLVLRRSNRTVAVLNASYTVAKTLAERLGEAIAQLESTIGSTIMTTDYIRKRVEEGAHKDVGE